jgi:hypothetical protein
MRTMAITSIVLVVLVGCRGPARDERYVVPSTLDGHVWIEYGVATAPSLTHAGGLYTIAVPESGFVRTSSPPFSGRVRLTFERLDGSRIRMLTPEETNSVLGGEHLSEVFVCCAGTTVQGDRTFFHFYVGHGPVDGRTGPP